ncbi:MAG: flagellar basal body-associated FliL family protein [bacterium]|nr:flagellar basal body-associated FliL family protein [bacterium]
MADPKKDAPEETGEKKKIGFLENKAILLGIIVVAQVVLAIGLTQFLIVPKLGISGADMGAQEPEAEAVKMPEMGVLMGLEEIIVTLQSDSRVPRYLRININLELKDQMAVTIATQRLPQLRDIVIMTLSNKTVEDLNTPEGKKSLRDEIFRKLDERMPAGVLMNIYFSDLVIQ